MVSLCQEEPRHQTRDERDRPDEAHPHRVRGGRLAATQRHLPDGGGQEGGAQQGGQPRRGQEEQCADHGGHVTSRQAGLVRATEVHAEGYGQVNVN